MKAKSLITHILFLATWFGFVEGASCEKDMQLKLIWEYTNFKSSSLRSSVYFDPMEKTLKYFSDGILYVVNERGEMIYAKSLETIIGRDRKDSIYFFVTGKRYPEIDELYWWEVDLARFIHFSRTMNCFSQFVPYKDGRFYLEMFGWDSDRKDYVLRWRSDIPPKLIETIRNNQRLPDIKVSSRGWMAIKSHQGDYCGYPNEYQDRVWIYDSSGVLTGKFFAGDEHFYECIKYDCDTQIDQGIIQRIIFSEDGTKLLIQGRSKENVDDQVFLVVDGKGVLLWKILLPCEEIRLIPVFCGSKIWSRSIPSPYGLRNFKTIIFGGKVFRTEPPELKVKTVDFLTPFAFNKDETKVIYTTKNDKRLILNNLIDGTSRTIFKFNFETPERDVYWNDEGDRIYLKTSNIWRIPIIGDIHYPKVGKSRFRIIDLKGKILYSAEIPGYSSGMKISADERVLFVRSGGQLRLYSINGVRD